MENNDIRMTRQTILSSSTDVCMCERAFTYRVGVADSGDVLTGSSVLHRQSGFVDHLASSLRGREQTTVLM